jgi:hypothetical protein
MRDRELRCRAGGREARHRSEEMEEHHHTKEREGAAARVRWEERRAEGGAEREIG